MLLVTRRPATNYILGDNKNPEKWPGIIGKLRLNQPRYESDLGFSCSLHQKGWGLPAASWQGSNEI
jgi:hypothetical protein